MRHFDTEAFDTHRSWSLLVDMREKLILLRNFSELVMHQGTESFPMRGAQEPNASTSFFLPFHEQEHLSKQSSRHLDGRGGEKVPAAFLVQ